MSSQPFYEAITAEQFLAIRFPSDRKYELVDGVIRMMTGGTAGHSRVASNVLAYLHPRLRGTGCRVYNSDMAVRLSDTDVRYPDVSVFCGDQADRGRDGELAFSDPVVIVEVLSPSTAAKDRRVKLDEYAALPSVDTIVLIDPVAEVARVVQRLGSGSWRDELFVEAHDVDLPALRLTVPHAEIFARD